MAHVWQADAQGAWSPVALDRAHGLRLSRDEPADAAGARIFSTGLPGSDWAILATSVDALRINGHDVPLGLRVLADRDEIALADVSGEMSRWYFSTEEIVSVVPFPGSDHATRCPRCKKELEVGMPSVRCPNPQCGAWHHQIPAGHATHRERECWTYASKCALCSQSTALDAGFRWTPEEL